MNSMMKISQNNPQKKAIVQLGKVLNNILCNEFWTGFEMGISEDEFNNFKGKIKLAEESNPWFTNKMIILALKNWVVNFTEESMDNWLGNYNYSTSSYKKTVLLICAGNLPLVGWHDILCCIVTKHYAKIKLSKSDNILIPAILDLIALFYPEIHNQVEILRKKPSKYDCVIATGSDNTNRYFEYYFGHVPNIFRKNRTSVAVLNENISDSDIKLLGNDIFSYFGLGCRSVTKIYIPKGFKIDKLFEVFFDFKYLVNHNKYMNNYDYNRSIYLLQKQQFLENGFLILKEDKSLFSPLSVLNFEFYDDIEKVNKYLEKEKNKIQCRVGVGGIPFGDSQKPKLWDYADGVDVIDFLNN